MPYGKTTPRNAALRHIPIKVSGIYRITNTKDGKFYIGSARNVRRRLRHHLIMLRAGTHTSPHLQRAWSRDGERSFRFDLIEQISSDRLIEREQFWLNETRCYDDTVGYNICREAGPPPVVHYTAEMREAISRRFKGIPKSADHRRKIGEAQRGKIIAPESIEKQRAAVKHYWSDPANRAAQSARKKGHAAHNKGVPLSEETKAKLSEAAKARHRTPEGRATHLEKMKLLRTPEAIKKAARTRSQQMRGKSNGSVRIDSDEDVAKWKSLSEQGMTPREIAEHAGVPKSRIQY